MPLEAINANSRPDALVDTNPANGDNFAQGDDHIRGLKTTVKNFYDDFLEREANPSAVSIERIITSAGDVLGSPDGHVGEFYLIDNGVAAAVLSGEGSSTTAGNILTRGVVTSRLVSGVATWTLLADQGAANASGLVLLDKSKTSAQDQTPLILDSGVFSTMKEVMRGALTFDGGNFGVISLGAGNSAFFMQQTGANIRSAGGGNLSKDSGGTAVVVLLTGAEAVIFFFKSGDTFANQIPISLINSQAYSMVSLQTDRSVFVRDLRIVR